MLKAVVVLLALWPLSSAQALFGDRKADTDVAAERCFAQAKSQPDYMVSGKGVAATPAEARALALQEIAQNLSVSVSSTVRSSTVTDGRDVSREDSSEAVLTSEVDLNSVRELCTVIGKDGLHYRVFAVDSRPPLQQVAARLIQAWDGLRPGRILWQGYDALTGSRAITELTRRLTSSDNDIQVPVVISLDYHSGHWVLSLNDTTQILRHTDVADFLSFPQAGAELSLVDARTDKVIRAHQLQEGQEFYFRTQSAPGSYVQILNIYEDGRVALLDDVRPAAQAARVPAAGVFEAVLLAEGSTTRDIYLMLSSSRPFSTPAIEQLVAWGGKLEGEGAYQLDSLLSWLNEQGGRVQLSAIEVVTRPR